MNGPIRCPKCKRPVMPNRYTVRDSDDGDKQYILCPFCQTKLFLPIETDNGSNPELHEAVRHTLRDPVTGRFISDND